MNATLSAATGWDGGTTLPRYSVAGLNEAIGTLLDRGFAPRFLLEATVSRPQLKKGHLWLSLTDGQASISAVVWASQVAKLSFTPQEGDGVLVVGRLNFWNARATLCVQVLDLRPSLGAVLRQFERVRALLEPEGLFAPERKRTLPGLPGRIALMTSVPSSALADMLRTARERWPSTAVLVVPIPVQGAVEERICAAVDQLAEQVERFGIDALVLARGGGSREDLTVFDGERLARCLARFPCPVVCGVGHEDDTTIADLVADYRAATPTAAVVALLPDRLAVQGRLQQQRQHLRQLLNLRLKSTREQLGRQQERLKTVHPSGLLQARRERLQQQRQLLLALSPQHVLRRGFSLVRDGHGHLLRSIGAIGLGDALQLQMADGVIGATAGPVLSRPGDPGAKAPQQT